jgi:hypothetical protein
MACIGLSKLVNHEIRVVGHNFQLTTGNWKDTVEPRRISELISMAPKFMLNVLVN